MSTMIITTDNQTITRMAVIAKRTDSEFMAGAKAMMVESLKRQMRGGVAGVVEATDEGRSGPLRVSEEKRRVEGGVGHHQQITCTEAHQRQR